ncbi:MAG: HAMP domain-containing histidine kinase [Hyphomicrobiaceae bacterium]|nr:HAMP domain-containing histidine kinase [Hyphomicrobiaceae bacterium]
MSHGSLRLRLLAAGAISILAATALSAMGLALLFERHVERRVLAELGVYLDQIIAGLDRGADGELTVAGPQADPRFAQPLSGLYWQIQAGETVLRSRSLWDAELHVPADTLDDGAVHQHRTLGPKGARLITLERRVTLPPRLGSQAIRAAVALDTAEITAATRAFAVDLLPYVGLIAMVLIAAAYVQVAFGLGPLSQVRDRLAAIREGRAQRLGTEFPTEVLPLAAEVDALLDARELQAERARARAADLAHGLKTPLQVLAGDVERLRQKGEVAIAADVEQVATSMQRHVDREIARARVKQGAGLARARVAEVLDRVLAVVMRTPAGARLEWQVDSQAELSARIDPDDLAEAVGNLLENAARHARRRVSVTASRRGSLAVILVADDGLGIPADRLEDMLARGGRLDEAGTGAGLGLAIVHDIAEAWAGRFRLRSGPAGLEAELELPA